MSLDALLRRIVPAVSRPSHRRLIEGRRCPEGAVAYDEAFLQEACAEAGPASVDIIPGGGRSLLRARRPPNRN